MKRWTKAELNDMDEIEFAISILKEKRGALGNMTTTALSEKLDKTIVRLEEAKTPKKTFEVGCIRAYEADDGVYSGVNVDIVTNDGDLIPVAVVEKYPEGEIKVHAYADINDDEPTYSAQVVSAKELETLL